MESGRGGGEVPRVSLTVGARPRWNRLQQLQLVLTDDARLAVTTAAGSHRGCRAAPRPVNYRSWDVADDSADCSAVTGHKGPLLDVSDLGQGRRTQVTLRWPEEMARGPDGTVSLAHICNQTALPTQQVRLLLAAPVGFSMGAWCPRCPSEGDGL